MIFKDRMEKDFQTNVFSQHSENRTCPRVLKIISLMFVYDFGSMVVCLSTDNRRCVGVHEP